MQKERQNILNILNEFDPYDDAERKDVDRISEIVAKYENIFVRECLAAHMTGSALVVNPSTRKFLLHNHKKLNKWLQFGGHADGETDLSRVALKEATEETGLGDLQFATSQTMPVDVELQTIPERKGVPEHYHLDFRYILFTDAVDVPTPDESESQDLRFFSFDEIETLEGKLDPALRRLVKKAEKLLN